jgi:hypothetical protein
LFLAIEAAKPGPLDLDLATVKADLALGLPPAVRLPERADRVTGPGAVKLLRDTTETQTDLTECSR